MSDRSGPLPSMASGASAVDGALARDDADTAGDGAPAPGAPVSGTSAANAAAGEALEASGFSSPALWLSLVAAAGVTAWWLRAAGAAHLYAEYYRLAAVCLGIALFCVIVAVVAAAIHRRRLRRAPQPRVESTLEPSSTPSD